MVPLHVLCPNLQSPTLCPKTVLPPGGRDPPHLSCHTRCTALSVPPTRPLQHRSSTGAGQWQRRGGPCLNTGQTRPNTAYPMADGRGPPTPTLKSVENPPPSVPFALEVQRRGEPSVRGRERPTERHTDQTEKSCTFVMRGTTGPCTAHWHHGALHNPGPQPQPHPQAHLRIVSNLLMAQHSLDSSADRIRLHHGNHQHFITGFAGGIHIDIDREHAHNARHVVPQFLVCPLNARCKEPAMSWKREMGPGVVHAENGRAEHGVEPQETKFEAPQALGRSWERGLISIFCCCSWPTCVRLTPSVTPVALIGSTADLLASGFSHVTSGRPMNGVSTPMGLRRQPCRPPSGMPALGGRDAG